MYRWIKGDGRPGDWMSGFLDHWIVHVATFLQPKFSSFSFFIRPVDSLAPARSALSGLRLQRMELPLL
jgi:hypothetical protein